MVVAPDLTAAAAHAVAVRAEHALIHAVPRLAGATVHIGHAPTAAGAHDPHAELAHHAA